MRAIVRDVIVVFAGALLIITMCLGTLAAGSTDQGWLERTWKLLVIAVTFDFSDPAARYNIVTTTRDATLVTAGLVFATVALLVLIAVPIGMYSATHPESRVLRVVRRVIETVSSLPVLLWCTFLVVVVARVLQGNPTGTWAAAFVVMALLMGDRLLADLMQRVQLATTEILAQPYMRLVRAGGFGLQRHLLQSLAGPIAATIMSRAMFLIGGAIVAERIFAMRGLGAMIVESLSGSSRDTKVALAASMALVVLGLVFRTAHRATVLLADGRMRQAA